jgi:hypothetical protein
MSEEKMIACPFCGWLETAHEKAEHIIVDGAHCLQCRRCKAVGPQTFDDLGGVTAWNKRAGGRQPATSETAGTKHVGISDLLAAADTFERVLAIIDGCPLRPDEHDGLRDNLPRVWPTVAELRRLLAAIKAANGDLSHSPPNTEKGKI